ncbi:MAG TPA: hypothetical protein VMT19_12440 [Thermoanaerobaculaceae bacterium]|nr:hypothetical protein [Thermoanaerobaculaceae bacterium]
MDRPLPTFARLDRSLLPGRHPFVALLPGAAASPALARIARNGAHLLGWATVWIRGRRGYAFVDVEERCIVLSERYLREGDELDLYLDLLHELTHLRQLEDGLDLWDERFPYVDRPTEVEAYAVAVGEGRRLGMTEPEIGSHLANPWMSPAEVRRLLAHVDAFLAGLPLPNLAPARQPGPRRSYRPW